MKRISVMSSIILLFTFALDACSNDKEESPTGDTKGEDKSEVTFWHAMSGSNGDALQDIVDKFNDQSDTVSVKAIYQGSYDESLNKLRAVGGSKEAPAIVQVFEIGTKYMSESGFITPMQEFIDKNNFDTSILGPNIASYYEIDGELNSMPFIHPTQSCFITKICLKKLV